MVAGRALDTCASAGDDDQSELLWRWCDVATGAGPKQCSGPLKSVQKRTVSAGESDKTLVVGAVLDGFNWISAIFAAGCMVAACCPEPVSGLDGFNTFAANELCC